MKIEDIDAVNDLARDLRNLQRFHDWQTSFRYEPSVEIRSEGVSVFLTLTYAEIDAIISRYKSDLEKQAAELGVEL